MDAAGCPPPQPALSSLLSPLSLLPPLCLLLCPGGGTGSGLVIVNTRQRGALKMAAHPAAGHAGTPRPGSAPPPGAAAAAEGSPAPARARRSAAAALPPAPHPPRGPAPPGPARRRLLRPPLPLPSDPPEVIMVPAARAGRRDGSLCPALRRAHVGRWGAWPRPLRVWGRGLGRLRVEPRGFP